MWMNPEAAEPLAAALSRFFEAAHEIPPHRLASLIEDTSHRVGALTARVWLVDHELRTLVHLTDGEREADRPVEGSSVGRAFVAGELVVRSGDNRRVLLRLVDGVNRIGVLELEIPEPQDATMTALRDVAAMAAAELVTRGQYTDLFTVTRRQRAMSLAAELQWQALPPSSFVTSEVTVAGMLEPAYETAGDTYDYAHNGDGLSFAILDAVGHDLNSTLISTLALGVYRNERRSGAGLPEIASAMDRVITDQLGDARYATGQLAHLDDDSGVLRWLNAGHPPPLLIRDDRVVKTLECRPRPPFGLGSLLREEPEVACVQLEPGDAVLLYTDGIVERRRGGGVEFGIKRLEEFVVRAFADGLSASETVRRLSKKVLEYHGGELSDDATTLLVVWHPSRD